MIGIVKGIYTAEIAGAEMISHESALLVPDRGIDGDRYATGRGHYSHRPHPDRQVTIIEQEVLDAIEIETGIRLLPEESRRNVVTAGVRLNQLLGTEFWLGNCLLFAGRENTPCAYLEQLIGLPVMPALMGRSGINCRILTGGVAYVGDTVGAEK
ncbi:MOSC domain-containing protein [Nocardia sp. NPDC003183]